MEYEWPKREYRTLHHFAIDLRLLLAEPVDRRPGEATQAMRALEHAHRSVFHTARIEVHAQCKHAFEDRRWRLYVRDAGLLCPRP